MKVLTTAGLTKLIQLIKSSFIKTTDTVTTQTVTLATVATTGDYDDLINKPTYTAGTGIDITSNTISVTAPTLTNTATGTNGLTINGVASNQTYAVNIGYNSTVTASNGTAVGAYTQATGIGATALGNGAHAQAERAVQLGYGTNSEANSFYVGTSSSNNWKMLDSAGLIPDARISTNIARTSDIPTADGVTIDTNSDDELEAIGTVNKNTAVGATAVKYDWIGTLAEYNAQNVETLHPEWVCYITDDVSGGASVYTKAEVDSAISTALTTMLDNAFPVGYRYITEASTCPLATLIPNSTWVLTSQGRVIQGADSNHLAGTTAEAGLPNISGHFIFSDNIIKNTNDAQYVGEMVGCFTGESVTANTCAISQTTVTTVSSNNRKIKFSAQSSDTIYGNSTTVQPPAEFVNIFKRTA